MKPLVRLLPLMGLWTPCTSLPAQTWDPDYGQGGVLQTSMPANYTMQGFSEILQQPNGRYIAAGGMRTEQTQVGSRYTLLAFDESGVLDTDFGTAGLFSVDPPSADELYTMRVASLLDGSLYLLGGSNFTSAPGVGAQNFALLMHVTADGELDTDFGDAGYVQISLGALSDTRPQGLSVRDDGSVNVLLRYVRERTEMRVQRYLANGQPDPNFTNTIVQPPASADTVYMVQHTRMRALADGAMLCAAISYQQALGAPKYTSLYKITGEGELDPEFGNDGWINDPATDGNSNHRLVTPIPVDASGRALVTEVVNSTTSNFRRYMPDGEADPTFGTNASAPFTGTTTINDYFFDAADNICGVRTNGLYLYAHNGVPISAFGVGGFFAPGQNNTNFHACDDGSLLGWWTEEEQVFVKRLLYDPTLSSGNEQAESAFAVFPNPVSSALQVLGANRPFRVQLTTVHGEMVSSSTLVHNAEIDVSGLAAGCYILCGYGQNGQLMGRTRVVKVP